MNIPLIFETFLEKNIVKRLLVSLLIGITVAGYTIQYSKTVHADIESSVIRFHVLANSDSEEDQELKLKVRDCVIAYLKDKLEVAQSIEETKRIINQNLDGIKYAAERIITENEYNYNVKCITGKFDFPTKEYGSSRFPAGEYYALRIIIGEGKGHNWWCVLYPQLCNNEFTLESKQKLKNVLSDDAYNIITDSQGNPQYKFKFRILELLGK